MYVFMYKFNGGKSSKITYELPIVSSMFMDINFFFFFFKALQFALIMMHKIEPCDVRI